MAKLPLAAKLRFKVNGLRLLREVKKIEDSFFMFGDEEDILDRYDGNLGVFMISCKGPKPFLHSKNKRATLKYIHSFLEKLKTPIYNARLLKVFPKSSILSHQDANLSLECGVLRIVFPIFYTPGISFSVKNRRISMSLGECWWVDVSQPHRLTAASGQTGLILVADVGITEELLSLFPSSVQKTARTRATFDKPSVPFFDPSLQGNYGSTVEIPFLFETPFRITSTRKAKTHLISKEGKRKSLLRDKSGLIRIQGEIPGLFLQKVQQRLRVERRGIISAKSKEKFTLSFPLSCLPSTKDTKK